MERRKRKKRRRGTQRGHHGVEKLRGIQTFTRYVEMPDGRREAFTIWVPHDADSTKFGWSVTPGFEAE